MKKEEGIDKIQNEPNEDKSSVSFSQNSSDDLDINQQFTNKDIQKDNLLNIEDNKKIQQIKKIKEDQMINNSNEINQGLGLPSSYKKLDTEQEYNLDGNSSDQDSISGKFNEKEQLSMNSSIDQQQNNDLEDLDKPMSLMDDNQSDSDSYSVDNKIEQSIDDKKNILKEDKFYQQKENNDQVSQDSSQQSDDDQIEQLENKILQIEDEKILENDDSQELNISFKDQNLFEDNKQKIVFNNQNSLESITNSLSDEIQKDQYSKENEIDSDSNEQQKLKQNNKIINESDSNSSIDIILSDQSSLSILNEKVDQNDSKIELLQINKDKLANSEKQDSLDDQYRNDKLNQNINEQKQNLIKELNNKNHIDLNNDQSDISEGNQSKLIDEIQQINDINIQNNIKSNVADDLQENIVNIKDNSSNNSDPQSKQNLIKNNNLIENEKNNQESDLKSEEEQKQNSITLKNDQQQIDENQIENSSSIQKTNNDIEIQSIENKQQKQQQLLKDDNTKQNQDKNIKIDSQKNDEPIINNLTLNDNNDEKITKIQNNSEDNKILDEIDKLNTKIKEKDSIKQLKKDENKQIKNNIDNIQNSIDSSEMINQQEDKKKITSNKNVVTENTDQQKRQDNQNKILINEQDNIKSNLIKKDQEILSNDKIIIDQQDDILENNQNKKEDELLKKDQEVLSKSDHDKKDQEVLSKSDHDKKDLNNLENQQQTMKENKTIQKIQENIKQDNIDQNQEINKEEQKVDLCNKEDEVQNNVNKKIQKNIQQEIIKNKEDQKEDILEQGEPLTDRKEIKQQIESQKDIIDNQKTNIQESQKQNNNIQDEVKKQNDIKKENILKDSLKEDNIKNEKIQQDILMKDNQKNDKIKNNDNNDLIKVDNKQNLKENDKIKDDIIKNDKIKNDNIKIDKIKKDNIKIDKIKKDTIQDDKIKKDTIQDDPIKNDPIKNDTIKNDIIKNDIIKNETIKNDTIKNDDEIKNDTIKNDTIKLDKIKKDTIKNETIKNEKIKNETIKNDIIKNDTIQPLQENKKTDQKDNDIKKEIPKPKPTNIDPMADPFKSDPNKMTGGGGGGYDLDAMLGAENLNQNIEDTFEMKLTSRDIKIKIKAYKEITEWKDETVTPDFFCKQLHLTIKERHQTIIPLIIKAFQNILTNPELQSSLDNLNFSKFFQNFLEFCMTNSKKPTAKKAIRSFIKILWTNYENKNQIKDELKKQIKSIKQKIKQSTLVFIYVLLKDGQIEELDYLAGYIEQIEQLAGSRTKLTHNLAFNVLEETFLWMGPGLKPMLKKLKGKNLEQLTKYIESVDPKSMKKVISKTGKVKKFDAFEMAKEQELPKEYQDTYWGDHVFELKKWQEKANKIDNLNKTISKISKLKPKTQTYHLVQLILKMFGQSIVILQTKSLVMAQYLANSLRKNFKVEAKQLIPVLLKSLKIKNKPLNEQITKTFDKFLYCVNLEDMLEDFEENLVGKNNYKKQNVLKLVKMIIDKGLHIKKNEDAVKIVKLVLKEIDGNDNKVREKACEIIANMKDQYNQKVQPLLSDLNTQKMNKILKYCTNPLFKSQQDDTKDTEEKKVKTTTKEKKKNKQYGKDKSQRIAQMKENLFSNKTVKISDTGAFSKFLETNLKNLAELTKDFKEVTSNQSKEIYLLIDEICQKVVKQAYVQFSRETIAKFYIEQIISKYNEDIFDSISKYLTSKNKIISTRQFLNDLFDVISIKNIKVTRDLLFVIVRLMENRLNNKGSLNQIAHKSFVEFLKANFTSQSIHQSVKSLIVNLMRQVKKRYGERVLSDYPTSIMKDYETQNKEIEKNFNKTLQKLNEKNQDKRTAALSELGNLKDSQKITLFWNAKPFIVYLKSALQTEVGSNNYKHFTNIIANYLNLYKTSKNDFSMKSFLDVFNVVLEKYYNNDKQDLSEFESKAATEELFNKTIEVLTPTLIFNNLISDHNSVAWREQIFQFYLQYGSEIDVKVKFIDFIVNIISNRKYNAGEISTLIDNVLLMLKTTDNDEIIIKGNENKNIREIWQKKEQDVLFEKRFVKGCRVFDDISFYNSVKMFIQQSLNLENNFFDKDISEIRLEQNAEDLKIKLAFLYLKSIENLSFIQEHIFDEISGLDFHDMEEDCVLIVMKIIFNLLKNQAFAFEEEFYNETKNLFLGWLQGNQISAEELVRLLSMSVNERDFLSVILENREGQEQDVSVINSPRKIYTSNAMNMQTPINNNKDMSYVQSHINISQNQEYTIPQNTAQKSINQPHFSPQLEELDQHFKNMLSFDLELFEKATNYFEKMISSYNKNDQQFLKQKSGSIFNTFTQIIERVFETGINYELDKESYQLIFNPLQSFCKDKQFINNTNQQEASNFISQVLMKLVQSNEEKSQIHHLPDDDIPIEMKVDLAKFIVKSFNSLMLKIIVNLQPNTLLSSLFNIIYDCLQSENNKVNESLYSLSFKCLLKFNKDIKNQIDQIDPVLVFQLINQYIQIVQDAHSPLTNNLKTLELILKRIVSGNNINFITECYHTAFGNDQVPLIWNVIMYYRQKQAQQMQQIDFNELREKILNTINIINSQNDLSLSNYFAEEISKLLQGVQIDFGEFREAFDNIEFFEIIQDYLNKNRFMNSQMNSQSHFEMDQSHLISQTHSRKNFQFQIINQRCNSSQNPR